MKISVELFGAAREFSTKSHLDFELIENSSIKDLRKQMIEFIDIKFKGNETFKKTLSIWLMFPQKKKLLEEHLRQVKFMLEKKFLI